MNTILFILFVILLIYIQIILSKMKGKFIGLILPIITFLSSINAFISIKSIEENIKLSLQVFIIINLFTLIFLLIYVKIKNNKKIN